VANSFRDDSVHAFADKENFNDLHITQVRFGGDIFLKPGTERFTEQISEDGKGQCEGNEQESPTGGPGPSKRRPGKGRRENRRGDEIGSTARVDGESAFTSFESGHRFNRRARDIFKLKIAEQVKARRVGMSGHGGFMRARKDVKRGVFKRVIASGFEYEREI